MYGKVYRYNGDFMRAQRDTSLIALGRNIPMDSLHAESMESISSTYVRAFYHHYNRRLLYRKKG